MMSPARQSRSFEGRKPFASIFVYAPLLSYSAGEVLVSRGTEVELGSLRPQGLRPRRGSK